MYLTDDVQDKPAGPGPAVVAAQQHPQGQQQAPGHIHEHAVQVHEGDEGGGAALVLVELTITTETPHVQLEARTSGVRGEEGGGGREGKGRSRENLAATGTEFEVHTYLDRVLPPMR